MTEDTEADPVGAAPSGAPALNTGAGRRLGPPAAETKRLYAADWAALAAWCAPAGQCPLPAEAATVAGFLQAAGATSSAGALPSLSCSVARRARAIADMHRQRGLAAPARDPAVKAVLRAARSGASRRRAPPPSQSLQLKRGGDGDGPKVSP